MKAHFDFADKDHNGKLDLKEMSKMIGNMDKGYMQSVVNEMMKIGDTKTVDGKLSLNEIIAHAKDFGSDLQVLCAPLFMLLHLSLYPDLYGKSSTSICQRGRRSSKFLMCEQRL